MNDTPNHTPDQPGRWVPGTPRPSEAVLRARFPGIALGTYLVYRRHDLTHMPLSQMRRIGQAWQFEDWQTMTRAQLRASILASPLNLSPVPHPLIAVPV